jgi:hypothetical protein
MRLGLMSLALLVAAAACERAPPRPIRDSAMQRGTALPPPAIAQGPSDGR